MWRYLFRPKALDLALLQRSNDATLGADVNDARLRISKVETEHQIVCAYYARLYSNPNDDSPSVLPRLMFPLFVSVGLERLLRFRCKSLLSVAENTNVCKSSCGAPGSLS